MYKCVFKEKRGDDIILSMQLISDGSEADEVVISRDDFLRANLVNPVAVVSWLNSQRAIWQKGFDPESLFAGYERTIVLPAGAQVIADDLEFDDGFAISLHSLLSQYHVQMTDFINWADTTSGRTKLKSMLPDLPDV